MTKTSASDEEDDYLSMTIVEPESFKHETSVQRRVRRQKEAEARGRTKSKAEQANEDSEILKTALSTPLDSSNKGFKMLQKLGYKPGSSLGISRGDDDQSSRLQPIAVDLKNDRAGVGSLAGRKRKFLDEQQQQQREVKHVRAGQDDFRVRKAKEKEAERNESLWREALRIFEALEEDIVRPEADTENGKADVNRNATPAQSEKGDGLPDTDELLTDVNIDGEKVAASFRRYLDEQRNPDSDRHSLKDVFAQKGLSQIAFDEVLAHQDDQDLDADGVERADENEMAFDSLDPQDRVDLIVGYLRRRYHYCFWCKHRYENSSLEGCPGPNEVDHD